MEGGPPGFPRDSSCPAVLWILLAVSPFHLHDSHVLRWAFPCPSVKDQQCFLQSATPEVFLLPVWPLPRSLATTCGISVDFFSSPYLDVSVQAVPLLNLFDSVKNLWALPIGVPTFGHPRINGHLHLPAAFRSLSRPSSAPDAKASVLRSFSLDLSRSLILLALELYGNLGFAKLF